MNTITKEFTKEQLIKRLEEQESSARYALSDGEITAAMEEKLKVNMARQWPEPKDGEPRLHIKEQSESVLPEIECDICGHVSTDPEGRHHCCEDNSND